MPDGVVRIIALDDEHETDPDIPTRPQAALASTPGTGLVNRARLTRMPRESTALAFLPAQT